MKVYVVFLFAYFTATIYSVKMIKGSFYDREMPLDDGELADFQKLLNKFNMLSSPKTSVKSISSFSNRRNNRRMDSMRRMRFVENETKEEEDDPDTTVIDIKFPDENAGFLESNGVKDKELKRMETLSNGLVVYNNKRTVNIETPDFSHLYFDLLENNSS